MSSPSTRAAVSSSFKHRFTPTLALYDAILHHITRVAEGVPVTIVLIGGRSFVEQPESDSAQYQAYFLEKLLEETAELLLSLDSQDLTDEQLMAIFRAKISRLRIRLCSLSNPVHEAADVGNVSMMLADPERRRIQK